MTTLAASPLLVHTLWGTPETWSSSADAGPPHPQSTMPQGRVRVVYTGWSQVLLGLWAGGMDSPLSSGEV